MNTLLFDLDGTLLPLDTNSFMEIYCREIGAYFNDLINGEKLVEHVLSSTKAMLTNSENKTNEEVFMDDFATRIEGDLALYKDKFNSFYDSSFLKVKDCVFETPFIKKSIQLLKEKGYKMAIATNPLFPLKAILHRIEWAGLNPDDFIYISSYEKNCFCKPSLKFYEEILRDIDKNPSECLMVGNDVQEDLIASKLGMKTFLIEDCILHRTEDEIKTDYKGSYEDFYKFVAELPNIRFIK